MPSYPPLSVENRAVGERGATMHVQIGTRAHQVSHLGVCVVVLVVDVYGVEQPHTAVQPPQMKTAPPRSVGHA